MYGMITSLVTVLWIAAYTLLANPAAGQLPANSAPAPVGCTGDYVCGDDPSVVATWPLDRWATVRRANKRIAEQKPRAGLPPPPSSDGFQTRFAMHANSRTQP